MFKQFEHSWTQLIAALIAVIGTLVLTAALAGCANSLSTIRSKPVGSSPISIVDDTGTHVILMHPARRIISLFPSNAEILLSLGLKKDIVGVDQETLQYTPPPWKSELVRVPSIGSSYPAVSIERIVALHPDLVLSYEGIDLGNLERFDIPVVTMDPSSVKGVYHDIRLVGKLTGTSSRASSVVHRMQSEISAIESKLRGITDRPTVFYDLGGLYTSGPHTFVNNLISLAGGVDLGALLSARPWPQVTTEQVVRADPQVILFDPEGTSLAHERSYPGFMDTRAFRDGRVYPVPNPSYIDEPSLALVKGLEQLAHLLHPHHVR